MHLLCQLHSEWHNIPRLGTFGAEFRTFEVPVDHFGGDCLQPIRCRQGFVVLLHLAQQILNPDLPAPTWTAGRLDVGPEDIAHDVLCAT